MTRQSGSSDPTAKAERLSKALRDNLKRRKAQARKRGAPQPPENERAGEKTSTPAKR